MEIKNVYEEIIATSAGIKSHGFLTKPVIEEMEEAAKSYPHLEVLLNLYDDSEDPNLNTWTDVEGMGYGWLWNKHPEEKWHEELLHHAVKSTSELLHLIGPTYFLSYEEEANVVYHFVSFDESRKDIIVTMSQEELFY